MSSARYIGDPDIMDKTSDNPPPSPSSTSTDTHPVAAVQVYFLSFSTIDAHNWFRRAEIQFRHERVNCQISRADHVKAALPDEFFPSFSEWLETHGDAAIKYDDLKISLLQRFTLSPESPTNGTPRKLDLLRALWILRIPEPIHTAIPNAEGMEMDGLQRQANHLAEALTASLRRINAIPSEPPPLFQDDKVDIAVLDQKRITTTFTNQFCYYHCYSPKAQPCITAAPTGTNTIFLSNPTTGMRFLVDTSTARSLLPAARWRQPHQPASNVQLIAANSTLISTYGCQHLEISIGGRRFEWYFIVADVTLPLLRADFLSHYQLLVDIARFQLVDTSSLTTTPIAAELTKFALRGDRQLRPPPQRLPRCLQVRTPGATATDLCKTRNLSPHKDIRAPEGAKPLVFITPHCDKEGRFPLTRHKNFLKTGPSEGVLQGPHIPGRHPKTVVTTPFGTFTLTSKEEHLNHLSEVLGRLQQNGLVVHYDKCVFGARKVDFLGHHLTPASVSPLPGKVTTIREFPTPTTVKALQEFVGMVSYYHRFLPGIAVTMTPLYKVQAGKLKDLKWGPPQALDSYWGSRNTTPQLSTWRLTAWWNGSTEPS
ncbi:uncharacterized protein LOC143035546 [Oratosquilla oratoria]|uniref:uncharacterized protein LOC143035546 n=1 Tax=Oratosquilla oratoria TaxID=337810 RepID=UPI003F762EEF